jgi:hypothetical protein
MSGITRVPIGGPIVAEFRGFARSAGEFTDKTTGEVIKFDQTVRFETEDTDGVLVNLDFGVKSLDEASDFDARQLQRGDFVAIEGVAVLGTDSGGYLRLQKVRRCDSSGKVKPVAAAV